MKEVIILGTGNSMVHCPYDCEVWGVNGAYLAERRVLQKQGKFRMDKLFLTDYLFRPTGELNFDIKAMNAMVDKYNCQLISLHRINLGKYGLKASLYPFKRIVNKFGTDYFSSTICYMLAYALDKGYKHLRLYGVDMSTSIEYYTQKAGVEFWIGMAMMKGCTVDVLRGVGSTIMVLPTGTPYGFKIKYDLEQVDPYELLKGGKSTEGKRQKTS